MGGAPGRRPSSRKVQLREDRCVAVAVQQIPKPLELVHDDQVGLQRVDAGMSGRRSRATRLSRGCVISG